MQLLINSAHGIYIPNILALDIIENRLKCKNKKDKSILSALSELGNTENEFYFESFETLLNEAIILDKDNREYYLFQCENGNLWAIEHGKEFETE